MPIGTALAIGLTAATVGGGIAQAAIGKSAAGQQADAIKDTSALAVGESRRQYDQNRADLLPWLNTGRASLNNLDFLMGLSPRPNRTSSTSSVPQDPNLISGTTDPRFGGMTLNNLGKEIDGGVDGGPSSRLLMPTVAGASRDPGVEGSIDGFRDTGTLNALGTNPTAVDANGQPITTTTLNGVPDGLNEGDWGSLNHDFTLNDFTKDPGYDFRLQEGEKALQRAAAARGNLTGGATMKSLNRFGQDYASSEYQNAFNRFNVNRTDKYNRYANLAGVGQQTATTLGQLGSNSANNIGAIQTQAGQAIGAANAGGTLAIGNGINNAVGGLTDIWTLNGLGRTRTNSNAGVGVYA